MISVSEFGAKGDAETDNTIAFAAAQSAAISRGQQVVYIPHGHYLVNIVGDNRVSWKGSRQETILQSIIPNEYTIRYSKYIPNTKHLWQRPFIEGIAITGASRSRNGILIENKLGVDLIDVVVFDCYTGINSRGNYYGTWDRLFVLKNEIGIHLSIHEDTTHTGNKRIISPQIRLNGIGVLIEANVARTTIYGGTIEANRTGLIYDVSNTQTWKDATGLHIRDLWFEANKTLSSGQEHMFRDGTLIPSNDLYVYNGTVVLNNCGASYVRVGSRGRLFSEFSFVGRGPVDAFLIVEEGGYVQHSNSLIP